MTLDLTAIKARHKSEYVLIPKLGSAFIQAQKDIDSLIAEVERLTKASEQMVIDLSESLRSAGTMTKESLTSSTEQGLRIMVRDYLRVYKEEN